MRNTCVVLEGHEEKHPRWPLAETTTTAMQEKKDKTQKGETEMPPKSYRRRHQRRRKHYGYGCIEGRVEKDAFEMYLKFSIFEYRQYLCINTIFGKV